jgi:glycosyltransferase involved in cell wall biosynthesis
MSSPANATVLQDRRPVVVVCSNLSGNCLGRALLLAELVPDEIEARVVGVQLKPEIWKPAAGFRRKVVGRFIENVAEYPAAARWLSTELRGARVVVSKPLYMSLGLTLRAGVSADDLLLDIDDWEVGLYSGKSLWQNVKDFVRPGRLNSFWSISLMDRKIEGCPRRLVSNAWLAKRYGGRILPHVRDTERLDPALVDRRRVRDELGMHGRFWVGFVGTMRAHKGNRELVEAVERAGSDVGLFVAGVNEDDRFASDVLNHARSVLGEERFRAVPQFPFDQLPKWLAAPDVIALPSLVSDASAGQIPAKLFDAMAMAKPVIATSVNDAAEILGGSGVLVPPGDVSALTAAIESLRDDEAKRHELGRLARARAEERFSYRSGRDTLMTELEDIPAFRDASV